ncbi:serine hydrolase [Deinococcus pimensis]|uniref:serine hydrolase n=1 Tax=Deinococcus pimensis TaxID=309888 RepID=UPI0004B197E3|nr:serine hydrolase [Deinococcus pimensis]
MNHQACLSLLPLPDHPGRVGVTVHDLATGELLFAHDADHVYHAASTIKVPLLIRALQRVAAGDLRLTDRHVMLAGDQVGGAGVLHELSPGLALTLRDLLTLMIVVSDNTATNMVIDRVGLDDVNAFLAEAGLRDSALVGGLQLPPERRTPRQRAGERNRTTARDMGRVLLGLARGAYLPDDLNELALGILSRQQYRDVIGRGLPTDASGEPLYRVASKSGELLGVHHDVGLVWTPRPLAVAVLSEGGLDPREHPDNREVVLLTGLAARLVAAFGGHSS